MIAVDSSALVAIFRDEPEAPAFIDILDGADDAIISVVTVVETMAVLCSRRIGAHRGQVEQLLDFLGIGVRAVDLAQQEAALDALVRFGKGRHPAGLNLGDCFSYALAKTADAPLLFKGDDFARTDLVPAWQPGR